MHKYKTGEAVKVTVKGESRYGIISSISKKTAIVSFVNDGAEETKRFRYDALTYIPPVKISKEELERFCRFETTYFELTKNTVPFENICADEKHILTLYDLNMALKNMQQSELTPAEIGEQWFFPLSNMLGRYVVFETDTDEDYIEGLPCQGSVIEETWEALEGYFYYEYDEFHNILKELSEDIDRFWDNETKPLQERVFTVEEKEWYISTWDDRDMLEKAYGAVLHLFQSFVNELCAKDNVTALTAKGYGSYGGNRAFECNWNVSKDCMHKLFELTGEPEYANTLGYIYYYGRCTDGAPQYEEAFKYFSIGAAGDIHESRYKLADMFANGYAVPQNEKIALTIISKLYDETLEYIKQGKFDCKFADIAFRMGKYAEDGITGDWHTSGEAYYYYLQADFTIRMRMLENDYYGDVSVAKEIKDAIERTVSKCPSVKTGKAIQLWLLSQILNSAPHGTHKYEMRINKLRGNDYKITIKIVPYDYENHAPKIFVTLPELGFCGMLDKINVKLSDAEIVVIDNIDQPIYFDDIKGVYVYLHGQKIAQIDGDLTFRVSRAKMSKIYKMVSVSFYPGCQRYDYFCDLDDISAGDHVIVQTREGEKAAEITAVFEKRETELALPLSKYKKVVRKA